MPGESGLASLLTNVSDCPSRIVGVQRPAPMAEKSPGLKTNPEIATWWVKQS